MEAVRISPLPLHSLLHSLHSALSQTLHYLRSSSCACSIPVDWTDPRVPLGLAHASITPSCGPRASPELVRVAARAFLLSFPDRQSLDHHSPVRILTISSRTPLSVHSSLGRSRAQLLDCIVVDIPLPAGALTSRSGPLTTLIYTANLDFKDYLTDTAVSRTLELSSIAAVSDGENKKGTSKASAAWTASSVQISEMDRLVDTWRNNRIDVVASQRRMHPYIITRLLASGITPIQRLSKRHIGAFERVSGAKAIGNFLGEGFKGRMGKVAGYMQAIVGERRNLLVFPMQDVGQGLQTIVSYAVDDEEAGSIESGLRSALKVLHSTIGSKRVFAGGGLTEAMVSTHLLSLAAQTPKNSADSHALTILAISLRQISQAISRNLHCSDREKITQLFRISDSQCTAWIPLSDEKTSSKARGEKSDSKSNSNLNTDLVALDGYAAKLAWLETGVSLACDFLRIDKIINTHSESESGEKGFQGGVEKLIGDPVEI